MPRGDYRPRRSQPQPSTRATVPLTARLTFPEVRSALDLLTHPTPPTLPELRVTISRSGLLIHESTRVLLRWILERHLPCARVSATAPWPTEHAHRTGDQAAHTLELLADAARLTRDYQDDGHLTPGVALAAALVAAVQLAGQNHPEYLEQGPNDDDLTDLYQIARQPIPRALLGTQHADLAGHPGAEDALLDGTPLLIHTRPRITADDQRRAAAVLLDARTRGHLTSSVHVWYARHMALRTYTAETLLRAPLSGADATWRALSAGRPH